MYERTGNGMKITNILTLIHDMEITPSKEKDTSNITWYNDYCFDCDIPIKTIDKKHFNHQTLSSENPEIYKVHR